MKNNLTVNYCTLLVACFLATSTLAVSAQETEKKDAPENEKPIPELVVKTVYNPRPLMEAMSKKTNNAADGKMNFLVFGDAKHSPHFKEVLKQADQLSPQFCITTADLVNQGAGAKGVVNYGKLDTDGGWFFKKYATWPSVGNHEMNGGKNGVENFAKFFGIDTPTYSFSYGNAHFIALDWPKVKDDPDKFAWLEKELAKAQGQHIFIFRHRPWYTVGSKSTKDVEGKATTVTALFQKYKVTAVFSGHDHIYYRTKRQDVHYVTSAGAGAPIHELKRASDAIDGDVFYGRQFTPTKNAEGKSVKSKHFILCDAEGKTTRVKEMFFVLRIKIDGDTVTAQMIDTNGNVWDEFTL